MNSNFPDQHSDHLPTTHEPHLQVAADASSTPPAMAEIAGTGSQVTSKSKGGASRPSFGALIHTVASQDYIGVLTATVVLVLVIGAVHPNFLALGQLLDILNQATFIAVLACGMAFLLAMRELDLSVGSIYALTSLCAALLMHAGVPSGVSVLAGLLIGAVLGLVNGLLIQLFRLPSIVATLATMSIYRGLTFALSNGTQVIGLSLTDPYATFIGGHLLGIPTNVWVMILVVAIFACILLFTPFGYRVRSIGSNPDAATFSGLPVQGVRLLAFVMMGTLGGLAGMLSLGYFGSSDPNLGTGYELLAIAAAVIGGTPLRGGRATIVGAALGSILLGVVSSGLAYFNVPINWTAFATGAVILLAVVLDGLLRQGRTKRGPQL
jgi:ribose transport system permease protein